MNKKCEKSNQLITTEMIQAKAYEISKFRKQAGISGSPESDWYEAKEQLKQELTNKAKNNNALRQLFSYLNQPLIKVEKNVWEPIDDWLKNAAIIQIFAKLSPILEAVGVLLIPVAIWWFTQSNEKIKEQQQKERREQQEQQQKEIRAQQAVQSYLNQLSGILVQDNLENNEKLRTIIRASTLALLENPDLQKDPKKLFQKDRRRQIIGYLSETELIILSPESKRDKPIISLQRANLLGANLLFANLSRANLSRANLSRANLFRANLFRANLEEAELIGANLPGAYLKGANLKGADLPGADLATAKLEGAKLEGAYLFRANLFRANLSRADLSRANLQGANLKESNLKGALYTNKNTSEETCRKYRIFRHPCPTTFPKNFNPKDAGMILVKDEE